MARRRHLLAVRIISQERVFRCTGAVIGLESFGYRRLVVRVHGFDVVLLDLTETGEHKSASDTTEDVGTRALEEGRNTLRLEDLPGAVKRAVVLDGGTRRHHHTATNRVNRVREDARDNRDSVTDGKVDEEAGVAKHGHNGVVETEVETTVDNNTDAGNRKATVESRNAVSRESLLVHVDEAVELALATLALGVVGQARTRVVKRVDEAERQGTGGTASPDVGPETLDEWRALGDLERRLDLALEGKVERLRREVPDDVGGVATPERAHALLGKNAHGAVHHAFVRGLQAALLDHLILVLDEELDTLDGGGNGLGRHSGAAGEKEVLGEGKLLSLGHC